MWSSDLSLTLTSDSHEEDEYAFVGKRKKTPLTIIPLGRYKPPRPTRANGGHRKGDEALRYAQQDTSAFNFGGCRRHSSSTCAIDDGGGPLIQSTPSPLINQQTAPPPVEGVAVADAALDATLDTTMRPPAPQALVSRCMLPTLPPAANPKLGTSAYAVGSCHARAVLCMDRLRRSISSELSLDRISTDLDSLRKFATSHALQLELWADALAKWNSFLRSLFPRDLVRDPRVPLSVSDGEALLQILPSSTTIAYCEANWRGIRDTLDVSPVMQKVLTIPGVAEMAVSLSVCLMALEAANCARRYHAVVTKLLDEFLEVPSYRRLVEMARAIHNSEEGSQESTNTISVWALLMVVSNPVSCGRLVSSLIDEDLFSQIRSAQLDEIMDLIEQVDLEIVFEQIRLYILNSLASLGQSLTLIRSVNRQVRSYYDSISKSIKVDELASQNCFASTGGSKDISGSDTTIHSDSTRAGSDQQSLFNEKNVSHRIKKLAKQVEGLRTNLRSQLARILADHLGLQEAQTYHSATPIPMGTLLKTIVIVIETLRNCSQTLRTNTLY